MWLYWVTHEQNITNVHDLQNSIFQWIYEAFQIRRTFDKN